MKLKGNINRIKNKRDSQQQEIEINVDQVEYITHKKDGRYYQPFEYIQPLETPLVITGDCLARTDNKHLEEGEHEFKLYDKVGDAYELNPDKHLTLTLVNDFDTGEIILTAVIYTVTVTNEEYNILQSHRPADKTVPKGKDRKRK